MNWIKQLPELDLSANRYSQYSEEVILKEIFKNIGTTNKYFVDVGAGGIGMGFSNTKELKNNEWRGLMFDKEPAEGIIETFITPFNIVSTLKGNDCPDDFDFLNVDIDSFDYDVIESILRFFRPRVICAEYNATLPINSELKLKYEEGYTWDSTNKYGFSWGAGVKLLNKSGYDVIMNHVNNNIFAVRKGIIDKELLNGLDISPEQTMYHPINNKAVWIKT